MARIIFTENGDMVKVKVGERKRGGLAKRLATAQARRGGLNYERQFVADAVVSDEFNRRMAAAIARRRSQ